MRYAYYIENTADRILWDNTAIFKAIRLFNIDEDYVFIDRLTDKTELQELLKQMKMGDQLFLRSLADIGNDLTQILKMLACLNDIGVIVCSQKELEYNLEAYDVLIKILLDTDRYCKDRVRNIGIEKALGQGKYGRPQHSRVQAALSLYTAGLSIDNICNMLDISRSTLYRALKKARQE